MLQEKISTITDILGEDVIRVKSNTPLSYIGEEALIGSGDRFKEVTDSISNVMTKELLLFKNTVMPSIGKTVKVIEEAIAKRTFELNSHTPDVVTLSAPEFVKELEDRDMLKLSPTPRRLPNTGLVIPEPTSLLEYLKTDNGSLGLLTKEFIDTIPEKSIRSIWNNYLTNISFGNNHFINMKNRKMLTSANKNDIYVLYVLLKNLENNVPDNVKATLNEYNDGIKAANYAVMTALKNRLQMEAVYLNSGVVVIDTAETGVIVNEDNYNNYLKNGGVVEVVFGAYIKKVSNANKEDLTEKEEEYVSAWKNYHTHMLSRTRASSVKIHKLIYINGFKDMIKELDSLLVTHNGARSKQDLLEASVDLVHSLNTNEIYDVRGTVRKLHSDLLYNGTNIKQFLEYLDSYMNMSNDMTVDRAITYAAQELITDYVIQMLEVTNK